MDFYTNVECSFGKILYRGVEGGRRVRRKLDYSPTFFVNAGEVSSFKTITGDNVCPVKQDNIRTARDFAKKYQDVSNMRVYGQQRFEYCYISDNFRKDIEWDSKFILIANLDIEVDSESGFPEPEVALEPVTAISLKLNNFFHVFGTKPFENTREDVKYYLCKDERDLLLTFINVWCENYPDIVTGWNVEYFDIYYIVNRIVRLFDEETAKRLSPWGVVRYEEQEYKKVMKGTYKLLGIAVWDYMKLFTKYSKGGWSHEAYTLDAIAFDVLGKKKISYEEYGNLRRLYRENHQLFIEYNIRDVELVSQIDDKEKIIDLCLTMAYDAKVNYEDVFSQVRMWDVIIYNYLREKKMVIPPLKAGHKDRKYRGAFVMEPQVGAHDWVASFDLTSLYPHLIMQFNNSPDTFIAPEDYDENMKKIASYPIDVDWFLDNKDPEITRLLKESDVTMTPNLQFFRKDRHGFLAEMMQDMFNDRKKYKKEMLNAAKELEKEQDPEKKAILKKKVSKFDNLQRAKKEALNSAYGALGNQYFRFYDIRLAEAVTTPGQLVIQHIGRSINEYLNKILKTDNKNYIIASDTDSVYVRLGGIVKLAYGDKLAGTDKNAVIDFMDKVCQDKIQPIITKACNEIGDYLNVYEQKMDMKREALATKGIWTAKKKYMLYVYDSEGVRFKEPEVKISGLEAVRSSTPTSCRGKIKEAFKVVLTQDEDAVIDFINAYREEFETLPLEDIAFPSSVRSIEDYSGDDDTSLFKKGSPMHVKATLYYNNEIKRRGLETKYEEIKEGEKVKYLQLKMPNPFKTPVIAFLHRPPLEFELQKYVDYDAQFEKGFLNPLKRVLDKIGWKTEYTNDLMSLMNQ